MSPQRSLTLALAAGALFAGGVAAQSLVELGTVTAIQGELTSTAVPNYLAALDTTRIRAVEAELREITNQLERYRADNGAFPVPVPMSSRFGYAPNEQRVAHVYSFVNSSGPLPGNLTYPIAYMTPMPNDPFSRPAIGRDVPYGYFVDRRTSWYLVWSAGPDNDYDIDPLRDFFSGNSPPQDALRRHTWVTSDPNDRDGDLVQTNRPF